MKILLFVIGITLSGAALANCLTNTYFVNGRMVVCTTCCYGTMCSTTCI